MSRPAKILVVVDDLQVRALLCEHFRGQGYAVVEAATASETFRQARYERPDLIVLDLLLPDIDGLSVLKQLRGRHPQARVIMLTVSDVPAAASTAVGLGAVDYLLKPVDLERLDRVVAAALGRVPPTAES